jgi:hypothetical protein
LAAVPFPELAHRVQHDVDGGLGCPGISRFTENAYERPCELDRLRGRVREPRLHLRAEQQAGGRGGLLRPGELAVHLGFGDLRRLTDPAAPVHIHVQAAPLEPVRFVRGQVQGAEDLRHLRGGHGRESLRQTGLVVRHGRDQQPADLLQLVPFEQAAYGCLGPQPLGQHRQRGQGGGLAAFFNRERREGIRPRRGARPSQHLGVAQ